MRVPLQLYSCALLLLLLTSTSYAQGTTQDSQLRTAFGFTSQPTLSSDEQVGGSVLLPKRVGLQIFAGATSGVNSGVPSLEFGTNTLSGGAQLSLDNAACSALIVGGAINMWSESGENTKSAEHWASFCMIRGVSNWTVGYRINHDVRQALHAPLRFRPGRQRSFTFEADVDLLSLPVNPKSLGLQSGPLQFKVFVVDSSMTFAQQDNEIEAIADLGFSAIRFERERAEAPDLSFGVDLLAVNTQASNDAFVTNMYAVRVSNLSLGPLYLDGEIGGGFAGAGEFIESKRERELQTGQFLGALGISHKSDVYTLQMSASRELRAAFGGRLVLDNRVEGVAEIRGNTTMARLRPFVGYTQVLAVDIDSSYQQTWGLGADLQWQLHERFSATATGDFARSFYASDSMNLDTPSVGLQALAGIVMHWDND